MRRRRCSPLISRETPYGVAAGSHAYFGHISMFCCRIFAVFSPYFQSFPPEMRNRKRKSFPREMRMCERHTDMEKQDQNKFLFVSITDQNMNEFADNHRIFWCTNGNKYSCFLMTTFQVTGIRSLTENGRKSDVNKRTWS